MTEPLPEKGAGLKVGDEAEAMSGAKPPMTVTEDSEVVASSGTKSAATSSSTRRTMRAIHSVRAYVRSKKAWWIDMFTGCVVDRPWVVLGWTIVAFIICMALVIAVGTRTTPPSEYEWEKPFDKFSMRRDMIDDAEDQVDAGNLPLRSDQTYEWYFFYDASPRNYKDKCHGPRGLTTARDVQAMCETEREIFRRDKYVNYFCFLRDGECKTPEDSVVRLLYGESSDTLLVDANYVRQDCPLLEQSEIDERWQSMLDDFDSYSFFFDENARSKGYPCKARSLMYVGTPLEGKTEVSDWDDKQYNKIKKRLINRIQSDLLKKFNMKAGPLRSVYLDRARTGEAGRKFDVLWSNSFLQDEQFTDAVDSDFTFAIASIIFVWIWLMVHTGSGVVGSASMLQILLSLPLALFFYRVVLQLKYISIMQNLVIFVILGIGADDIFVYNDAWLQSKTKVPALNGDADEAAVLKKRTKFAYSRAFQAIFNTSFTTAVAFFATAISDLVPIASFGIFAAICVIMNFALVLTVTPAVVVLHYRRFVKPREMKEKEKNAIRKLEEEDKDQETGDDRTDETAADGTQATTTTQTPNKKKKSCCSSRFCPSFDTEVWVRRYLSVIMAGAPNKAQMIDQVHHHQRDSEIKAAEILEGDEPDVEDDATLASRGSSVAGPTTKPVAWLLVVVFAAYAGLMCAFASNLTPPQKQEVWFTSDHMDTRTQKLFDGQYGSNDASFYPVLSIVWGMDKLRRGNFDPYVPHANRGDVSFSNPPKLFETASQNQVLETCRALRDFNCESGCVGETLTRPNTTVCFLEEFQAWHVREFAGDDTYGLTEDVFNERLIRFRDEEVPQNDVNVYATWQDLIGVVDGRLRFFRIDARLSLDLEDPIPIKRQVLRRTNRFVSAHARNLDAPLPDVWQYSESWIWYKTQKALVDGLLTGMAIAFPIAFVTLAGATQNVVLAFFAMITIGAIVSSVLGLAWMLGWSLGVKESVAGVIVIGLAVDYTIHLGHMYDHARVEGLFTREEKAVSAVWAMGPTIFAGAVTTAGASIFLLAAQLTFFTQMGILILSTIISSLFYTLFFYVPLIYVLGPQGNFGNLRAIQHWISDHCCRCCGSSKDSTAAPAREVELHADL